MRLMIFWAAAIISFTPAAAAECESGNSNVRIACFSRTTAELRGQIAGLQAQIEQLRATVTDISSSQITSAGSTSNQPESNGGGEISSCPAGSVISGVQIYRHSNGLAALTVQCNSIGAN